MLTAAHGDRIEAQAEAAGADLFLTKPFSPLDLLRLVDRLGAQSDRIDGHDSAAGARQPIGSGRSC